MDAMKWALEQMPGDTAAKLVLIQMAAEIDEPALAILAGPPWSYDASPFRVARLAAQCGLDERTLGLALESLAIQGLIRSEESQTGGAYVLGLYADRRVVAPWVCNKVPLTTALREAALERDGHACVTCGATEKLHVDHVYPRWLGGLNVLANLQTLCAVHNLDKGMAGP